MKNILYIILLPLLISAQYNDQNIDISSKKLVLSFQSGAKIYAGNHLLEHTKFTREGVFYTFSFFTKKNITKSMDVVSMLSFVLSNAIAKEIDVTIPETEIDFVTKIPNILNCNINYSLKINKPISRFLDHELSLKFRLFPLFYKKGNILTSSLHSLGGLVSSEQNGSLPDLEKATQIAYSINYMFNNITSLSLTLFMYSDWSIKNYDIYPIYPGLAIKFEKIINQNFKAPWLIN